MRLLKKIISKLRIKEVHIEKVMAVPPQAGMLHGKRVLLIGGSQGIGKAIAERFIQSEAKVVIVSRREIGLDDALASAEYRGNKDFGWNRYTDKLCWYSIEI